MSNPPIRLWRRRCCGSAVSQQGLQLWRTEVKIDFAPPGAPLFFKENTSEGTGQTTARLCPELGWLVGNASVLTLPKS